MVIISNFQLKTILSLSNNVFQNCENIPTKNIEIRTSPSWEMKTRFSTTKQI